MTATLLEPAAIGRAVEGFIAFLETNEPPVGLFEPDVFGDVTYPMWRLQAGEVAGLVAIRRAGHPCTGKVIRHRTDPLANGFVLEVEESWVDDAGARWYCRELFRAELSSAGRISEIAVYCTGDWDEAQVARHAAEVELLRP